MLIALCAVAEIEIPLCIHVSWDITIMFLVKQISLCSCKRNCHYDTQSEPSMELETGSPNIENCRGDM